MFDKDIENIRYLTESGFHEEAITRIDELRNKGCKDSILLLFEALAKYDAGNDLECLKFISEFLDLADDHEQHDYALFTSAICLMNLGLASEARLILKELPDDYPDIEKERRASEEVETSQRQAISCFIQLTKTSNA